MASTPGGLRRIVARGVVAAGLWVTLSAGPALAQGLIWSLPEDGTWVRFEGTYHQVEVRPDSATGNIPIDWIRHITIKSVGTEDAEYDGATVPCRWIEIKVVTGTAKEGIDAGPVGTRIIKVLVPESRVIGKPQDDTGIPVAFLPVIKGFKKLGDGDPTPYGSNVLQVYPLLTPMMPYRTLTPEGDEDPMVKLPDVTTARKLTANLVQESYTTKTENKAEFWESADVPFGLAKWKVEQTCSTKDRAQPRDKFALATEMTLEMAAVEKGTDAQSELQAPNE